ncbi:MAG: hypothetical protein LC800_09290 [Acidobacteria bacterium]|nr:hypothetical protein [Acidobacteriota bacterium]
MKASLIVIALALLACLVWLGSRPDAATGADASRGPTFEVQVEKPRMDRFLGGILPTKLEAKLMGEGDAWPSSPLTLRGSFAGLPHGRR